MDFSSGSFEIWFKRAFLPLEPLRKILAENGIPCGEIKIVPSRADVWLHKRPAVGLYAYAAIGRASTRAVFFIGCHFHDDGEGTVAFRPIVSLRERDDEISNCSFDLELTDEGRWQARRWPRQARVGWLCSVAREAFGESGERIVPIDEVSAVFRKIVKAVVALRG